MLHTLLTIALALPAAITAAPDGAPAAAGASLHIDRTVGCDGFRIELVETGSTLDEGLTVDDGRGTPYIVDKSDNICGLDQPRQLTSPAKVDYKALLDETPEAKKIERDKIDPKSSEGITLMTKARARVLKACESVRAAQGHCSVWKVIRRRDGKALSDITDAVKRKL